MANHRKYAACWVKKLRKWNFVWFDVSGNCACRLLLQGQLGNKSPLISRVSAASGTNKVHPYKLNIITCYFRFKTQARRINATDVQNRVKLVNCKISRNLLKSISLLYCISYSVQILFFIHPASATGGNKRPKTSGEIAERAKSAVSPPASTQDNHLLASDTSRMVLVHRVDSNNANEEGEDRKLRPPPGDWLLKADFQESKARSVPASLCI